MKKLMLIGGGSNGHGSSLYETREIDEEIVKMTGKINPTFLFIGLANSYSDAYYDVMKGIYRNLGCNTVYLKKSNIIKNPDIVKKKINDADIIYMGGGDTIKLISSLRQYNIDKLILEAVEKGCVLAGISAGAIAISNSGLSDYQIINNISEKYVFATGLAIVNIDICPHGNDSKRIQDLKGSLKNTNKKVLVLENGTALKINGEKKDIVKSISKAKATIGYWKDDIWIQEEFSNK